MEYPAELTDREPPLNSECQQNPEHSSHILPAIANPKRFLIVVLIGDTWNGVYDLTASRLITDWKGLVRLRTAMEAYSMLAALPY